MSRICVTKALKNASRIQAVAPHIIPRGEPLDGFASRLPLDLLARLHKIQPGELEQRPDLAEFVRKANFPAVGTVVQDPLFSGTLRFVQVAFTPGNFTPVYSQADPAGIGTDDLRSPADRVFAFDFHSDLFLVAQPDRTLVCQDRARRHSARGVQVSGRLAEKAHEIYPALQQRAQNRKVALLRSYPSHYSQFSCYSPLVIIGFHNIHPATPSWHLPSLISDYTNQPDRNGASEESRRTPLWRRIDCSGARSGRRRG
jgi:hypothetical protein